MKRKPNAEPTPERTPEMEWEMTMERLGHWAHLSAHMLSHMQDDAKKARRGQPIKAQDRLERIGTRAQKLSREIGKLNGEVQKMGWPGGQA